MSQWFHTPHSTVTAKNRKPMHSTTTNEPTHDAVTLMTTE